MRGRGFSVVVKKKSRAASIGAHQAYTQGTPRRSASMSQSVSMSPVATTSSAPSPASRTDGKKIPITFRQTLIDHRMKASG